MPKHKMPVDNSSKKIGRSIGKCIRKCIEKCKCCKNHTFTKRPHSSRFAFQLIQIILCFSYETNIRPSNYVKIFEKCMKPREQIQMTKFQLISSELVT